MCVCVCVCVCVSVPSNKVVLDKYIYYTLVSLYNCFYAHPVDSMGSHNV